MILILIFLQIYNLYLNASVSPLLNLEPQNKASHILLESEVQIECEKIDSLCDAK